MKREMYFNYEDTFDGTTNYLKDVFGTSYQDNCSETDENNSILIGYLEFVDMKIRVTISTDHNYFKNYRYSLTFYYLDSTLTYETFDERIESSGKSLSCELGTEMALLVKDISQPSLKKFKIFSPSGDDIREIRIE